MNKGRPSGKVEFRDVLWAGGVIDGPHIFASGDEVYIITADRLGICKVGISVFTESRIKCLQTQYGRGLRIHHQFVMPTRQHSVFVEREAHAALAHCRASGRLRGHSLGKEWFRIEADEAVRAVSAVIVSVLRQRPTFSRDELIRAARRINIPPHFVEHNRQDDPDYCERFEDDDCEV